MAKEMSRDEIICEIHANNLEYDILQYLIGYQQKQMVVACEKYKSSRDVIRAIRDINNGSNEAISVLCNSSIN